MEEELVSCFKCKEFKAKDKFFNSKNNGTGVSSRCKTCSGSKGLFTHAKLVRITVDGVEVDGKDCGICRQVKPMGCFPVIKGKRKGIGGRYSNCTECEKEYRDKLHECPERLRRRATTRREYESQYHERRKELYETNIEKERIRSKIKDSRRFALQKRLRADLREEEYEAILSKFDNKCAVSAESEGVTMDHFIPLWTGHGGTHKGNVYPLNASLNYSKQHSNPFEWVKQVHICEAIDHAKWGELVAHLAKENGLTEEKFKGYVYWCYNHRREVGDINEGNSDSTTIYKEQLETGEGSLEGFTEF